MGFRPQGVWGLGLRVYGAQRVYGLLLRVCGLLLRVCGFAHSLNAWVFWGTRLPIAFPKKPMPFGVATQGLWVVAQGWGLLLRVWDATQGDGLLLRGYGLLLRVCGCYLGCKGATQGVWGCYLGFRVVAQGFRVATQGIGLLLREQGCYLGCKGLLLRVFRVATKGENQNFDFRLFDFSNFRLFDFSS